MNREKKEQGEIEPGEGRMRGTEKENNWHRPGQRSTSKKCERKLKKKKRDLTQPKIEVNKNRILTNSTAIFLKQRLDFRLVSSGLCGENVLNFLFHSVMYTSRPYYTNLYNMVEVSWSLLGMS